MFAGDRRGDLPCAEGHSVRDAGRRRLGQGGVRKVEEHVRHTEIGLFEPSRIILIVAPVYEGPPLLNILFGSLDPPSELDESH